MKHEPSLKSTRLLVILVLLFNQYSVSLFSNNTLIPICNHCLNDDLSQSSTQNNLVEITNTIVTNDLAFLQTQGEETKVDSTQFNAVFTNSTKVEEINGDNLVRLPIGLSKDFGGGSDAQLVVVNAYFTTEYVMLDVLAKVGWNGKDVNGNPIKRVLRLGAWNVKYYYKGGFQGEPKLALLEDVAIPVAKDGSRIVLEGDFNKNTGQVNYEKATYIGFGCNGIESLEGHFIGSVILDTDKASKIKPVTLKGDDFVVNAGGFLEAKFNTTCSLDNFFFSTSLGLFTIGNSDLIFDVKEVTIDLSASKSADYIQTLPEGGAEWEGFYMKDFTVYLPKSISKADATAKLVRTSASAQNLYVDENGISAVVSANNISTLENGNAGGWPLAVSNLSAKLEQSVLSAVSIEGAVRPPVLSDTSSIKYTCIIDPKVQTYAFKLDVIKGKPLGLDVFFANISLGGGGFKLVKGPYGDEISATLSEGKIALKGDKLSNFSIGFQEFSISNAPSISIKTLSPQPGDKPGLLADFPITLNKFSFANSKLNIGLNLNLMENKIGGAVDATITCKSTKINNRQKWVYEGLKIGQVAVNAEFDKFAFKGNIEMFESATDKGFKGDIALKMALATDSLKITANAIFGAKIAKNQSTGVIEKSYRYWHVDMMSQFPPFTVFTGVQMSGLGGGAANHMFQDRYANFVPDSSMGMFFRVNTELLLAGSSGSDPSQVALEMQFNKNWGLMYIQLFGKVSLAPSVSGIPGMSSLQAGYQKIASASEGIQNRLKSLKGSEVLNLSTADFTSRFPVSSLTSSTKAEVSIDLLLNMDFYNKIFSGKASTYINAGDMLVGNQSTPNGSGKQDGYAGSVYMVFKQNEWFVHAGYKYYDLNSSNLPNVGSTPIKKFEPLGLKLAIGSLNVGSVAGYLLVGHHIPELPNPKTDLGIKEFPNEGIMKSASLKRGSDSNFEGKGLALGVAAQFGIPDIQASILTAKLKAYMGFDVLLKHYNSCVCSEWSDKNNFGLNNWYAQGQAYAGMKAKIGINVDLWVYKGYVEMAEANMAILLEAKLPRPTGFNGTLVGEYSVLDGLVKDDFSLSVSFGDKCGALTQNQSVVKAPEVNVVNSVYPKGANATLSNQERDRLNAFSATQETTSTTMSTLDKPSITFNYTMNEPLSTGSNHLLACENMRGTYTTDQGKAMLKSATLLKSTTLQNQQTSGDSLQLVAKWVGNKKMYIELADENASWPPNSEVEVEVDVVFKEKVNNEWVVVTSMVDGVARESRETITLRFKTGNQPVILENNNIVEMYPAIDQDYFYKGESSNGFIEINKKQDYLLKDAPYTGMLFISEGENDQWVSASYSSQEGRLAYPIPNLANNKTYTVHVQKGLDEQSASTILTFSFHTSKFNTIDEKLNSLASILSRPESSTAQIPFSYEYGEPFGREEILGNEYMNNFQPLIQASIDVTQGGTYLEKLINYIYTKMPRINSCGNQSVIGLHVQEEIIHLKPYSTDWDLLKEEMELESTFPFVVTTYNKLLDDLSTISDNINSICANNFYYCSDLAPLVEEFKQVGSCSYTLPNLLEESSIPVRLTYSYPNAGITDKVKNLSMNIIP